MATSNEILFDQLLQQQTYLQKGIASEAASLVSQLSAFDAKTNGWVTSRLTDLEAQGYPQTKVRTFIRSLRDKRDKQLSVIMKEMTKAQADTAKLTLKSTMGATQAALAGMPVDALLGMPDAKVVGGIANNTVFGGEIAQTIKDWGINFTAADRSAISGAIQAGVQNGLTTPQIVKNVRKAEEMTRNNADALTKTALNHGANTGRQEFFEENSDVMSALRWNSVLDGRTSPICQSLDGHYRPVELSMSYDNVPTPHLPQGGVQQPPAHIRCRSLLIGILDGEAIADQMARMKRPTVMDTRTGKQRQIDFESQARADAKAQGKSWNSMSKKQKAPYRAKVRKDFADKYIGSAPGDMNYNDWLRKQPMKFKEQVLGKKAAQIYEANPKMTVNKFVATDGAKVTLAKLEANPNLKPGKYKADQQKAAARQKKLADAKKAQAAKAKAAEKAKAEKALKAEQKKTAAAEKKAAAAEKKAAAATKKAQTAEAAAKKAKAEAKAAKLAEAKAAKPKPAPKKSQSKLEKERIQRTDDPQIVTQKMTRQANRIVKQEMDRPLTAAERLYPPNKQWASRRASADRRLRNVIPQGEDPVKFKKWLDSLDDEDMNNFRLWGSDEGASAMRAVQRKRAIRGDGEMFIEMYGKNKTQAIASQIEDAIASGPGYPDTVQRGMLMRPAKFAKLKKGGTFSEGALASGTYNPKVASDFARMRYNQVGGEAIPVILRIEGGMGTRAVNISQLTGSGGGFVRESEILISGKVKYTITNMRQTSGIGGQLWEITLRVTNK